MSRRRRLAWLHVAVPGDMRGLPIGVQGVRDAGDLKASARRMTKIGQYRLTAAEGMVLVWVGLMLALGAFASCVAGCAWAAWRSLGAHSRAVGGRSPQASSVVWDYRRSLVDRRVVE